MLSRDEKLFLEKRRRFAATWNAVGIAMLAVLAALAVWLYVTVPGLIYPPHVIHELKTGTLSQETLRLPALLLPIVVLALFAVTALVTVYGFYVFRNERRYLRMIEKLAQEDSRSEVTT
jgi:hypothetical protein